MTLAVVVIAAQIGLRLLALGVIPGNRKPSTGMAWLLLIMIEPFIGFTAFLLLGRTELGRKRSARQASSHNTILEHTSVGKALGGERELTMTLPPYVASVAHLNHTLGTLPLQGENSVEFVEDYRTTIEAMARDVDTAERYVHVEFYIAAWDDVTDVLFTAMERAAARGVQVRLLFDHIGSLRIPGYRTMVSRLEGTGIQWYPMLPIAPFHGRWRRPDLRNHRKLLVVDGTMAWTGSLNLTEPGYNKRANHRLGREWVELMVRLEGPVVAAVNAVFAADWYTETEEIVDTEEIVHRDAAGASVHTEVDQGHSVLPVAAQLVPSGPGHVSENNLRMFNSLIYAAQERLSIASPYFVPDESLLSAVTTAAHRGVQVELFVSEISDQFLVGHAQASYYRALLESGVRIWAYPAPWILHAKHFSIDDTVAVVGSSNMDMRSFSLNYEVSLMMLGPDVVRRMREVEDHYRSLSTEITLADWLQRPARLKFVDNVARLTSALQ